MNLKPLPLTLASAKNATLLNLLATPGLGSLLVGKFAQGLVQLALAVTGFCFVAVWFVAVLRQYYGQLYGTTETDSVAWLGLTGGALFLAGWIWALLTSISLLSQARRSAATMPVPPVISP